MNAEEKENLRIALLRVLEVRASERFGLRASALPTFLIAHGFRGTADAELRAELHYLADKGLAATVGKTLSPENQSWRITAAGRDFLAAEA